MLRDSRVLQLGGGKQTRLAQYLSQHLFCLSSHTYTAFIPFPQVGWRLSHDNLLRTFGIFEDPRGLVMVMEYAGGGSLHTKMMLGAEVHPVKVRRVYTLLLFSPFFFTHFYIFYLRLYARIHQASLLQHATHSHIQPFLTPPPTTRASLLCDTNRPCYDGCARRQQGCECCTASSVRSCTVT